MNQYRFGSVSIVATLAFAVSQQALAEEKQKEATVLEPMRAAGPARVFGKAGQLAISSDAGLFISNTNVSGQSGSTTTLQLRPAIDFFVIDNLSVGGFLGLDYTNQAGESGHTTAFSIGPRVGYDVALSGLFSIWPKLGFSYSHTTVTGPTPTTSVVNGAPVTTTTNTSTSSDALALNIFVPFMVHPAEHFFIGFGPAFDVDLTGDNKATTIAGRLTIGGWI